jgi:short-subunit dehydrogenase
VTSDLRTRYPGWALVTGASSGIGEAFAVALARRGFPVVLVARRKERLEALAKRLAEAHGVDTLVVAEDLSQHGACERVRAAVGGREVGLLVNNAGFGSSGRFAEEDPDVDDEMIALNCAAVVRLTHLFLRPMLGRKNGAVIVVASAAGYQPGPWFAVYAATKAFDLMFAEALWCELRGSGVDVLAVSPGETQTEFHERAHAKRQFRGATAESVAEKGLAALGRTLSVAPGLVPKLIAFSHRLFPRRFVVHATGAVLARELLVTSSSELRRRPYGKPPTAP